MIAAVILAAGESRRMGSHKALLPYRGVSFVDHLMAATRHPRIGLTRVVLGAGADEISGKLKLPSSQVVINREWEKGPLSSLRAALQSLPDGGTEGLLLCLVDHPLITSHLVSELIEVFDATGKSIVLPTYHGRRGHPVLFRNTLYGELMAAPLDVGARAVVRAHADDIAAVPTEEEGVILNLNDPDTLHHALPPL